MSQVTIPFVGLKIERSTDLLIAGGICLAAFIYWRHSVDKLATINANLAAAKAAIPGQVAAATAPKPDSSGAIAAGQLRDLVAGGPPHHHHHGGGGRGRGGWGFGGGWDGGGTTVVLAGSDWVWDPSSQTWVQVQRIPT